jgi:DNA-binding SARP family transcriptional activator
MLSESYLFAAMPDTIPRLALICFGPPTARVDGGDPPADVLWRKHLALLVYLALSPDRTRSRDHLLGLLWPEKTQDKARHSLNEAVRRLRAGLGSGRLVSEGETVRLEDTGLDVDAVKFGALAERDPAAALALLRGDFLEGFTLDDAPAFEDWAAARRTRYGSSGVELLLRQGEAALGESRFRAAREAAGRALQLNPSSEMSASLLMRAAALSGDAAEALSAYHRFRERLREDIGEEPGRELQSLAERIRSSRWQRASVQASEAEPPLLGRKSTHAAAFGTLEEGIKSGARCLVISGEPGMGKSRLVSECAERLTLAGAVTAVARALESDHDAPWSTLRLLARSGLTRLPGVAGADSRGLGVLAGIVPELAERFDPVEVRDSGEVAAALQSLLGAVADEQPVGVLLDGAHLADGHTIGALGAAVRGLGDARVVLVLALDPSAEQVPRELLRLMGEVGRGLRGAAVRLDPLELEEMREMVAALAPWCEEPEQVDRLARRLTFEAGGNALYAVTLLRGLDRTTTLKEDLVSWPAESATMESPLPFTMPQLANMAVVARLADMDQDSQTVLKAASVTGVALDVPLVAALAELPVERVEEILDGLEQRRLVVHDGTRYAFHAALIPQVIRSEGLTRGQRQRLRSRAVQELAARTDLEARVLRVELSAKVGTGEAVFDEAIETARAALQAESVRTARRALFAAERMEAEMDPGRQEALDAVRRELAGGADSGG